MSSNTFDKSVRTTIPIFFGLSAAWTKHPKDPTDTCSVQLKHHVCYQTDKDHQSPECPNHPFRKKSFSNLGKNICQWYRSYTVYISVFSTNFSTWVRESKVGKESCSRGGGWTKIKNLMNPQSNALKMTPCYAPPEMLHFHLFFQFHSVVSNKGYCSTWYCI